MSRPRMGTAPPNFSSVGNNKLVYRFSLLKFSHSISLRLLPPRTSLTIVPNLITTDQNIFFPCFLLANLYYCKIRRLPPGIVMA